MHTAAQLDWTLAYYIFCGTVLTLLAGLIISVRQYMWLSYCAQGLTFFLYFAALDGHLAPLLGMDPTSTPLLAAATGSIACASGFAVCGLLLRREHQLNRLRPALLTLSALALAALPALLWVEVNTFHQGLAPLFWLMVSAQVLPPITWFFLPSWGRHLVMPVTVLVIVALALSAILNDFANPLAPGSAPGVRRGIMLWIVCAGATAMLAMTGIIQRARIRSGDRALQAAQGELEALRLAQQAERDMHRARELANARGEQLATAAHDIRQPLVALRASASALGAGTGSAPTELTQAIDYVESLAAGYLNLADDDERAPGRELDGRESEAVDAQLIVSSMQAMFASDAHAAGIQLRTVDSSLRLYAPPLVLLRIAANCVTNAIKHSSADKVVVGWRRRLDGAELWVADNGSGVSAELVEDVFVARRKDADSNGSGLGLAIVKQLASENGWGVELGSELGKGTLVSVGGVRVL